MDLGAVPDTEHFDRLATFQITGSTDEPEIIELPVQLTKTVLANLLSVKNAM